VFVQLELTVIVYGYFHITINSTAMIKVELFQPEPRVVVDGDLANLIVVYQAARTSGILFSRNISTQLVRSF